MEFYLVSVPPQQFITVDGGIVEVGAEVQFGIVDIVTMVKEVADHQDILRYGAFAPFSPSPEIRGIRAFALSSQIWGVCALQSFS